MPFGFRRGKGGRGWGGGRGFRGGRRWGWFGLGGPYAPQETCICPNCQTVVPHERGLPCFQTRCPNCGTSMTRQFFQR